MKLIGMINNETTPKISIENICFTIKGSDANRGGGIVIVIDRAAYNQGENAKYDFEVKIGGGDATYYCERSGSYLL